MGRGDYRYYRRKVIRRNLLFAVALVLLVVLFSVFLCNTFRSDEKNADEKGGNRRFSRDSSLSDGKGDRQDDEGGDIANTEKNDNDPTVDKSENNSRKTATEKTRRKKKRRGKAPASISRVKKVQPEKVKLPPKAPTLEIIGSDGKVLMKKE